MAEELLAVTEAVERAEAADDSARTGEPTATSPDSDYELAKRCAIVKPNANAQAQGLCTIFDNTYVPLPSDWAVPTWAQAYKTKKYRSRIQVLISKDKKRPA